MTAFACSICATQRKRPFVSAEGVHVPISIQMTCFVLRSHERSRSSVRPPPRCLTKRARKPQRSLAAVVGMRNRLVHAYFDVDADILWTTVTESLPALLNELPSTLGKD